MVVNPSRRFGIHEYFETGDKNSLMNADLHRFRDRFHPLNRLRRYGLVERARRD